MEEKKLRALPHDIQRKISFSTVDLLKYIICHIELSSTIGSSKTSIIHVPVHSTSGSKKLRHFYLYSEEFNVYIMLNQEQ